MSSSLTGLLRLLIWGCLLITTIQGSAIATTYGVRDYCEGDTFQARCASDEVILMQRAIYGRMRLGRCVKVDMGYIGCAEDVLDLADGKCSGRQECDISIPDTLFEKKQPCLELKSYLEASYSCLKVIPVDVSQCRRSKYLRVTSPKGYIASTLSLSTWCGTSDTPWLIEALPGQRINITLYDFGVYPSGGSTSYGGESFNGVEVCQKYAVVREEIPERSTVLCGGRSRIRHVYLSNSNSIQIGIEARSGTKHHFLLQYEVLGCPDPTITANTWFKRENNEITIGCKDSDAIWRMKCVGNKWIGDVGNCSRGLDKLAGSQLTLGAGVLPKKIVIVTVCGIAFVVGVLILMIGIFFFRKYKGQPPEDLTERRRHSSGHPKITEDTEIRIRTEEELIKSPGAHCKKDHVHYKEVRKPEENHNTGSPLYQKGMSKNEYTHIWEMPLPTPEDVTGN